MARPLRLEYPGALYHLTSRGNAKNDIFHDDADRRIFLNALGATVTHFDWLLYAYCLMGNHYHLLAETPTPNLSRGMRQLNGTYTQRFNYRHKRVGHLFQGRFTSIVVERETYLLELVRYIALNPVRSGFVSSPERWRWSSYRPHAQLEPAAPGLRLQPVLERFGTEVQDAARRYRDFVFAGIGRPAPWSQLRGRVLLGSDQFAERLRPALKDRAPSHEVPRADRFAARPALHVLLAPAKIADRALRNAAILEAHTNHGYAATEIARHLRLHCSTVSRIVQRSRHDSRPDPD
jgi:REP element-mobilizing transposase RayT